jgi:hypothetical protein
MVDAVKLNDGQYSRLGKNARQGWLKVKVPVGDGGDWAELVF